MNVRFHDNPVLTLQMPLWRSRLVLILLVLGFASLAAKALHLQGLSTEFLQRQGERRYERTLVLPATRGKIYDRSGSVVLASSVPARAIWAIPEDTRKASPEQLGKLAELLGMSLKDIERRLVDIEKTFVYIKRQVDMETAEAISALRIPGFHQQPEMRRIYPDAEMTAHILGFINIEDEGIEGVELVFREQLSGTPGSRRVIRDRLGRVVEDVQAIIPPTNGQDLYLSVDAGIQFELYTALQNAVADTKPSVRPGLVFEEQAGE